MSHAIHTDKKLADVERILNARSIAFVGASPRSHTVRGMVSRLRFDGFSGPVWMVNPNYKEIHGYPCFATLKDLPATPDLIVVTIRASKVPEILEDAAACGIRAAMIYSTGFADAGAVGLEHVEQLKKTVDASQMAICGPGSFGFINVYGKLSPFSAGPKSTIPKGNVGMVAQSGGFVNVVALATVERGFGFSHLIATGSEVFLTAADFLAQIVEDENAKVLVAVLEEIRDIPRFERFLFRAMELDKPVIVLPLGRSQAGQRATSAHSGALAARSDIQEAFLRRAGAIVVSTFDDLIETIVLASSWGDAIPARAQPLFMTISGGDAAILHDLANDIGFAVPELSQTTIDKLAALLPESTMLFNPVDLGTRPRTEPQLVNAAYEIALADPAINISMTRLFGNALDVSAGARAAAAAHKPHMLFTRATAIIEPELSAAAESSGSPILQGMDRALSAVQRLSEQKHYRQQWQRTVPSPPMPDNSLKDAPQASTFQGLLTEAQALDILRAAGLDTVPYGRAQTADEAIRAANEIGYPVVVKIDSADIEHKSEIGGVRLNVFGDPELQAAMTEVLANVARMRPEARVNGVIIQPMLRPSVELIFGSISDERFGPAVLVGLGGLLAETLGRSEIWLAPFDADRARKMLESLLAPSGMPESGWRGLDIESAAAQLAKFSQFAAATASYVDAIDINPVGVFSGGKGARALDCLILSRSPDLGRH